MHQDIIERLHVAVLENRRVWLVTVIASRGSTPGKPGMKMLVYPDGSFAGTIGGGQVERDVLADISDKRYDALAQLTFEMKGDFGSSPGMSCGGSQDVLIESFGAASQLFIIGAGHCAMELSELASRCAFSVTVVDDRPEWASCEKHPRAAVRICDSYDDLEGTINFSDQAYIVIMTHQHAHDEEALRACLHRPWRYLGMIGSKRKAGLLLDKLASEGIDRGLLGRIRSPIGLDIGSETTAEIAVSIVAQLIEVRNGKKGFGPGGCGDK